MDKPSQPEIVLELKLSKKIALELNALQGLNF
jgi:hypothetical protein